MKFKIIVIVVLVMLSIVPFALAKLGLDMSIELGDAGYSAGGGTSDAIYWSGTDEIYWSGTDSIQWE